MDNLDNLENLKNKIENMNKQHQIEILRILKNDKNILLNENINGVFVNLSDINEKTINMIKKYILYVDKQNTNINQIENKKEELQKTYFTIINKDISCIE